MARYLDAFKQMLPIEVLKPAWASDVVGVWGDGPNEVMDGEDLSIRQKVLFKVSPLRYFKEAHPESLKLKYLLSSSSSLENQPIFYQSAQR